MKAASVHEIKKELSERNANELQQLCMRLARHKVENKELLTYLLFEAHDEAGYIRNIQGDLEDQFDSLQTSNVYFVKKGLRRILRLINKQIRFSGQDKTEVEVRIAFCEQIRRRALPVKSSQVLMNLFLQQMKKIDTVMGKLDEDLRFDYQESFNTLLDYIKR